ncbi:AMP-dependent synthetase and ligase [Paraburkholderia unamae]|uniref:AMP-binding protein n=1 Tax=Paraburkholderia unamae TaxID=219649 RepID=UPI001CAB0E9C|nr:AMP-binding protein [Paraburkholderia unamae]CAG9263975.1 AMP-dependent synthetase and ligase [Paraburkholderia unamae]
MSETTLFEWIERAPPAATALVFGDARISYGELRERAQRIAGGLNEAGIGRHDTVALWLPNLPDWLAIALACARLGAAVLCLNMRYGPKEVGQFMDRTGCKALCYMPSYKGKDYESLLRAVDPACLAALQCVVAVSEAHERALAARTSYAPEGARAIDLEALACAAPLAHAPAQPGDACIILSSSGTTSQPKLIVHAQGRVLHHGRDVAAAFGIGPDDARLLLAIPLCGAFGYTIAMTALAAHAPLVLMEGFDPAETALAMVEHRVTHMFGTNDMLDKILAATGADWTPRDLRMYGHANFTPGLVDLPKRAEARGILMRGCFGMSETLALFAAQPADAPLDRRAQSGGVPLAPDARIRVRCLRTGALLGAGEPGELEIATPDIMTGYLGNAEATAKAFTPDGFLRTGDIACLTGDGGFNHLSRIGDVLRIGGYLVNPLEIEEVVLASSGAHACQVVAVEAQGSARPVAFVVGSEAYVHEEHTLLAACRAQLAIFKVPVRIFRIGAFPVTPSPNGEKVKKNELQAMARELLASGEARS